MLNKLIFAYFAAVMLVSAVMMITRKNPVHSVLYMLVLFFHIAGVFVLLNAEFLAAVQLIVYAGAILVLYLFVAMLLSVDRERQAVLANRFWPWLTLFGALVVAEVVLLVLRKPFAHEAGRAMGVVDTSIQGLGKLLYQGYLVPFEVASLLLLVGLVGSVMLAKRREKE